MFLRTSGHLIRQWLCCIITNTSSTGSRGSLLGYSAGLVIESCEFESRQERRENFFLQSQLCVLTLIRCPFHPRVTAVARKKKKTRPFCQKCRWQVTPKRAHTSDPTNWSGLIMPLSRHSVGTYQETSSHATRLGTLCNSRLSSLSHCELILA